MAYASLGPMYGANGESALATEDPRKAYESRDRASDHEKFFITAYYHGRELETRRRRRRPARRGRKSILVISFLTECCRDPSTLRSANINGRPKKRRKLFNWARTTPLGT